MEMLRLELYRSRKIEEQKWFRRREINLREEGKRDFVVKDDEEKFVDQFLERFCGCDDTIEDREDNWRCFENVNEGWEMINNWEMMFLE